MDGNKLGDELTSKEVEQLCEASADYLESVFTPNVVCGIKGAAAANIQYAQGKTDAELQDACTGAVEACNDAEPEQVANAARCDGSEIDDCKATVSDIEICIQEVVDKLAEVTQVPECNALTRKFFEDRKATSLDESLKTPTCEKIDPICSLE